MERKSLKRTHKDSMDEIGVTRHFFLPVHACTLSLHPYQIRLRLFLFISFLLSPDWYLFHIDLHQLEMLLLHTDALQGDQVVGSRHLDLLRIAISLHVPAALSFYSTCRAFITPGRHQS